MRPCAFKDQKPLVVLLYPDISNFTFQNVKILKCKVFLINFLDELGNFKQKKFYTAKCKFFYILKQQTLCYQNLFKIHSTVSVGSKLTSCI